LTAGKERDDVLRQLYDYQEKGALYDPATLSRVGNFHGATHGIFWTLVTDHDSFTLECKLINLSTAKIEHTAEARFESSVSKDSAAAYLGDMLLAQLAEGRILTPTGKVVRSFSVRGYSHYWPKSWTLWITMLPEHNAMQFPQQRLSPNSDHSWYAPAVYAGPEGRLAQSMRLEMYALLTDPEYANVIQSYLDKQSTTGLDINSWNKQRYRVLDHVQLIRTE
jgi:hypothetical protein